MPIDASCELLSRAQAGDPQAFQELVRPHLVSIRRFVGSLASNREEADDIAQETWIRAFRAFGTFDGRSALSTWLCAVARSACFDWYRSRVGGAAKVESPLSSLYPALEQIGEDALTRKREVALLWHALHRLDERSRVPLILFEIEGLSYDEIAALEGIPVGTVRSRLNRARQYLRELLAADGSRASSEPCGQAALPPLGPSRLARPGSPASRVLDAAGHLTQGISIRVAMSPAAPSRSLIPSLIPSLVPSLIPSLVPSLIPSLVPSLISFRP